MKLFEVFSLALLAAVVGVTIGILSNWISPPAVVSRRKVIIALLVLCVVAAVLTTLSFVLSGSGHQRRPPVSIVQPNSNAVVGYPTELSGTIRGDLATGHQLWALNRADFERNYHPDDVACSINDGTWTCPELYLGTGKPDDRGKKFVIYIVDADPDAARDYAQYGHRDHNAPDAYTGIDQPFDGSTLLASKTVTRD